MAELNPILKAVLENWPALLGQNLRIETLGNAGGFSGASFWRIQTPEQTYCLRRWPQEHPTQKRLAWIHAVLGYVANHSDLPLAIPLSNRSGTSFVQNAGHLWELTAWLPGEPVEFLPSPIAQVPSVDIDLNEYLQTAMRALATFHLAAATCPHPEDGKPEKRQEIGTSPGLVRRKQKLEQLLQTDYLSRLRSHASKGNLWPIGVPLACSILEKVSLLAPNVLAEVHTTLQSPVALKPCVRDIWSDHLLFTSGKISGWVDFGAMQTETPSGDIARLLASMSADNSDRWQLGLNAYTVIQPLSDQQLSVIRTFDACQVLLAGINWIDWIFAHERKFEQMDQVEQRLQNIELRLIHRLDSPENFS